VVSEEQVSAGKPKPIRFANESEKQIKIYAIETDKTFSEAVRYLCDRGLASVRAEAKSRALQSGRRILSRGVVP